MDAFEAPITPEAAPDSEHEPVVQLPSVVLRLPLPVEVKLRASEPELVKLMPVCACAGNSPMPTVSAKIISGYMHFFICCLRVLFVWRLHADISERSLPRVTVHAWHQTPGPADGSKELDFAVCQAGPQRQVGREFAHPAGRHPASPFDGKAARAFIAAERQARGSIRLREAKRRRAGRRRRIGR